MATTVSRQQLYQWVWERPITTLALEFGLSDVALRKICRKHDIPTPGVGFWAKLAHGKPITVTPLPDSDRQRTITIYGGLSGKEPDPLTNARAGVIERLKQPGPDYIGNPIVERTIARLKSLKPNRDGLVRTSGARLISVTVRPDCIARAADLLRQLVAAGECLGLQLGGTGDTVSWHVDGQTIGFELFEAPDRLPHTATDSEQSAHDKWRKDREDYHRRHSYWKDWGEPKIPTWEERYQGRLAIRLESVRLRSDEDYRGQPIRGTFADSRTRDVTRSIPTIIATIAAMAAAKRLNVGVVERRREADRLAAERWEAAERRRAHEQRAMVLLDQLLVDERKAAALRSWLDRKDLARDRDHPRISRLLRWAESKLEQMESELVGDRLEAKLTCANLFGEE